LGNYTVQIQAVNAEVPNQSPKASTTIKPVETSYGTWLPPEPVLALTSAGRTITIIPRPFSHYGAAGVEYQINKAAPTADLTWYAPAFPDIVAAQSNEAAWKATAGGVAYEPGGQLTQMLPLQGQASGIPVNTTYQYRARAVTAGVTGAILYQGAWSQTHTGLATASSAKDIAANAVNTAQLNQSAVTGD
jgi:hypothetical protein